jgi:hypothetical protein
MRFEVFTAVRMMVTLFSCVLAPCRLIAALTLKMRIKFQRNIGV